MKNFNKKNVKLFFSISIFYLIVNDYFFLIFISFCLNLVLINYKIRLKSCNIYIPLHFDIIPNFDYEIKYHQLQFSRKKVCW
jgi:hypothetical protein